MRSIARKRGVEQVAGGVMALWWVLAECVDEIGSIVYYEIVDEELHCMTSVYCTDGTVDTHFGCLHTVHRKSFLDVL